MIWWPRKTNETNRLKVKTWGGFNLAILKVKQIYYKIIEVFTIRFSPKSIATSSSKLLARPRSSFKSTNSFFSWTYCNTSTHTYDFEIPLKGFRSPLAVDLVAATSNLPVLMVWEWFLIMTLKVEGTIPFRSHKSTSKVFWKHVLGFPLNTMWNRSETLIT